MQITQDFFFVFLYFSFNFFWVLGTPGTGTLEEGFFFFVLVTVTVTVTGNLLNTKALTLVSRLLSQPVQSPSDMRYTEATGTKQRP